MDRRQFLLAVPGGALLPSWASAQEPVVSIAWQ